MRSVQTSRPELVDGRTVADRILARVRQVDPVWGTYALDLTFDALLEVGSWPPAAIITATYVLSVMDRRNARLEDDPQLEPLPFAQLSLHVVSLPGGNPAGRCFCAGVSRVMRETVERSPDGLGAAPAESRAGSCVLGGFHAGLCGAHGPNGRA
jgi:hypothetical protein